MPDPVSILATNIVRVYSRIIKLQVEDHDRSVHTILFWSGRGKMGPEETIELSECDYQTRSIPLQYSVDEILCPEGLLSPAFRP